MLLLLSLAVCIRLVYFIGFVGGHPQDDGIFVNIARSTANGMFPVNLHMYMELRPQYIANPAETFAFRLAFVYPLALCFYLFGEGDRAAGLFPLLCSLITLIIVYYVAKLSFNRRVAVISALLCACYPFDIIHASRILADETFAAFVGLAFLMFLLARHKQQWSLLLLSGVFFGLAYLTKLTALPLFLILLVLIARDALRARSLLPTVYYCAGLCMVVLMEGLFYYSQTGSFFLHYKVVSSTVIFKYTQEGHLTYNPFPLLRVEWADAFYHYYKMLFNAQGFSYYNLSGFGLFYYGVAAGLVAAVTLRKKNQAGILALWLILVYLYFEFAPLQIYWHNGQIVYRGIYKHLHYLTVLTVPALPFAGYIYYLLWQRYKLSAVLLFGLLAVSAYFSLEHDYTILRQSQHDSRSVAAQLQGDRGQVYADYLMLCNLRYYMGKRASGWDFQDINHAAGPQAIRSGYVILGGSRGIELVSAVVLNVIPGWAREFTMHPDKAPEHWQKVAWIKGKKDECRKYDAMVYQVGATPSPKNNMP